MPDPSHADRLSPHARARAEATIEAAAVFAEQAHTIVAALPQVPAGHVLVAVVDAGYTFTGTHHVDTEVMVEKVPELEGPDGWAMVITPGASVSQVRRRAEEWQSINAQRIAMIDRITARRAAQG